MAELRLFFHDLYQLVVDFLGIAVQNAYPVQSVDSAKLPNQFGQCLLSIDIRSVYGRLLRNDYQFFYTFRRQRFRFLYQAFHRNAPVTAAHPRNNTVCAMFVTAFRNFQISVMTSRRKNPLRISKRGSVGFPVMIFFFSFKKFVQRPGYLIDCRYADNDIDFRNLLLNLFPVTLCKASGRNERPDVSVLPQLRHFQNRIDTLLLRIIDKAACIDYDNVRFRFVVRKAITLFGQKTEHPLRIDQIFIAPKRDE